MNQLLLLNPTSISQKTVLLDNIKATFTELGQNNFDIILEVNSNKFLIAMNNVADQIEQFEIIAIKGFVELSNRIILLIRQLIQHLRYRLDF